MRHMCGQSVQKKTTHSLVQQVGVGGHVGNPLAIMTSAYGLPSAPPEFWMAGDFCTLPTRLIRQSGLDSLAQIMLHSAEITKKNW